MIAVKIYFTNIVSFTKVTCPFQNSDLQFLQFDIRSKCMYPVSKVLKHAMHSQEPLKYILKITMKIVF